MERTVLAENLVVSEEGRTDGPRWAEVQQEVSQSADKHKKGGAICAHVVHTSQSSGIPRCTIM